MAHCAAIVPSASTETTPFSLTPNIAGTSLRQPASSRLPTQEESSIAGHSGICITPKATSDLGLLYAPKRKSHSESTPVSVMREFKYGSTQTICSKYPHSCRDGLRRRHLRTYRTCPI